MCLQKLPSRHRRMLGKGWRPLPSRPQKGPRPGRALQWSRDLHPWLQAYRLLLITACWRSSGKSLRVALGPGTVAIVFEGRELVPGRCRDAGGGGGPLRKSVATNMPDTERLFSLSHPASGLRNGEQGWGSTQAAAVGQMMVVIAPENRSSLSSHQHDRCFS